jgi:phenylacetate-coenzyme A ligase PaaK-like adenylate-forming protein
VSSWPGTAGHATGLLELQRERLRALVAHAVAASPYHREVLGADAASGDVPLRELPTLSKATMMDNFDRIVTDRRLRRAALEARLSAPTADRAYLGRYKLFTTAGTTGVRGLLVEDLDEFAVWIGTCLRGLAGWGLGPATRLAGIGSPSPCTSPTRCTRRCWAARPAPPLGWPSRPRCLRW